MSVAPMQSTYPKQHCGCDFCCSRRSVNAKKLMASQMALHQSGVMQRNGCNCNCHKYGPAGVSSFDPDYPEPVNQTLLNASRGRNGVPGGNQYTIRNSSGLAAGPGASQNVDGNGSVKETAEQRQAREAAELDALERLLMLEYKARAQATMEADRLKRNASSATPRCPQPLPVGYMSSSMGDKTRYPDSGMESRCGASAGEGYFGPGACTIHDAYAIAHSCPAEPPVQCHASHRLQDTMDSVRKVTADPINNANRHALQRLLHENGMAAAPMGESGTANSKAVSGTEQNVFGSTLAEIRSNYAHPRGAGVVWVPKVQSSMKDSNVLRVEGGATAGAGNSKSLPTLSPGAAAAVATTENQVTYAV
ncbi:hypothetical protein JKF63_02393 [Porcisia hertigi]|uniref:Uncharacterized protein n=1 Tax=Porcisia hertigi TaxID=2761500 RepID=A0A836I3Y5_9TRYP|nr:hypothetical protein JKF63_02393 [Porcisia hertigi]